MLVYPERQLAAARDVLDALGFQGQTGRDAFPEDRPMRTGLLLRCFHVSIATPGEATLLPLTTHPEST
jgi:hypothetical protein